MADLKLDSSGDLALDDDINLVIVDGVDAIAQDCECRLLTFQGEWFLDSRIGVPWFQKILGEKPRLNAVTEIIQKAILSTDGVEAIENFELDFEGSTRTLSISFDGQGTEGQFTFTTELIIP